MNIALHGSCQCGQVTFSIDSEPLFVYACHCSQCQKRTGSAFSMGMVIPASALHLDGELTDWERTSDEGNTNVRHSCAACGNIIYGSGGNTPDLLKVQPGTVNDNRDIRPEVHIWTQNAQHWITLPANVPRYETQPDSPLELMEAVGKYRSLNPSA